MTHLKNFKFTLLAVCIVILIFIGFSSREKAINCTPLLEKFDDAMIRSTLPIIENSGSLCHGLYFGSDMTKIKPQWAVATLSFENNEFIFRGVNKTGVMSWFRNNRGNISTEDTGRYYKMDMQNRCRYFFSSLDSQMPSMKDWGRVKPIEVKCLANHK